MRAKLEACGVGPSWIDSTSFKLDKGQAFVNCYVKATEVQLVPLDAHILVLGKPTLCVAYDEADVSIPEAVGGRKTFDVGLAFTNADGKVAYELSMVPAQAHAGLFDFIRRKKREAAKRSKAAAGDAGENREAAAADGTAGDEEVEDEVEDDEDVDDSDDDEDDDFNPGEGSEPEEEYDSDGGVPQDGSIRDYDDAAADDTDEGEDEDEDEDEPACKKAKPETDAAHDEL
ncbi:hypothetical protein T492DRAFT_1096276 [Pavlovales sp. CCMP2436]|nr:hypothetical protein T492DRAFT_1096276 [Pavlovales sp. CCMP2436]